MTKQYTEQQRAAANKTASRVWRGVFGLYLAVMAFLCWAGVSSYLDANSILANHAVAEAEVALVDESSRTRRGHTSTTYTFEYTFSVAESFHSGTFSAVNDKADKYFESDTIAVAYAIADPTQSGVHAQLEKQGSFFDLLKRLLAVAAIVALLALLLASLIISKFAPASLEDDEDEQPVATATA